MPSPPVRYALIALCLAAGAWLVTRGTLFGWPLLAAAGLLSYGQLRSGGGIALAFQAYQQGDLERVGALLGSVRPHLLRPADAARYDWLHGVLDARAGRYAQAHMRLTGALRATLLPADARARVHCHLAEVTLLSGDAGGAREHLQRARTLQHGAEVDGWLRQLEHRLSSVGRVEALA